MHNQIFYISVTFSMTLSFFVKTYSQCQFYLDRFFEICRMIILPIKHSKMVLPTSKVVLHGTESESVAQTIQLPLRAKLSAMAKGRKASLREVQSLVGSLQYDCRVISPGRTFCCPMINLTLGKSNPNHLI